MALWIQTACPDAGLGKLPTALESPRTNVLEIKMVESGIKMVPYKQPPSLKPNINEGQVARPEAAERFLSAPFLSV